MAVYGSTYLISQNRHGETEGKLYFFNAASNAMIDSMHLPVSGNPSSPGDNSYNHPGGIQVIGDYLLIPIQTQDYKQSKIQLWDISPLKTGSTAITCIDGDYIPNSNSKRAGGIGIANLGSTFLVVVCDNDKLYFYQSTGSDLTNTAYNPLFEAKLKRDAAQTSLLMQTNGTPYLAAFTTKSRLTTYQDWGVLCSIDIAGKKMKEVADVHFYSNADSSTLLGPHFRWGATTYYPTGSTLGLMTTQRVMQPKCQVEVWDP